jgi:hypothetical protein
MPWRIDRDCGGRDLPAFRPESPPRTAELVTRSCCYEAPSVRSDRQRAHGGGSRSPPATSSAHPARDSRPGWKQRVRSPSADRALRFTEASLSRVGSRFFPSDFAQPSIRVKRERSKLRRLEDGSVLDQVPLDDLPDQAYAPAAHEIHDGRDGFAVARAILQ